MVNGWQWRWWKRRLLLCYGITLFLSVGWLCLCVYARMQCERRNPVNPSRYLKPSLDIFRSCRDSHARTPRTPDYIHSIRLLLFPAYHFPCFNFPLVCFTLWEFCHCYFTGRCLESMWHGVGTQFLCVKKCSSSCGCAATSVPSFSTWVASTFFDIKISNSQITFGS